MKIGLDVMGGDYAPKAVVLGAIEAFKELPADQTLVLFGDSEQVKAICAEANFDVNHFQLVHTDEVIGMGEHGTKAVMKKPNSSISVGFAMLAKGEIDSFASAGNTGAMLVGAMFSVKPVEGVSRPCMPTHVPKLSGGVGVLLDVGANADCKPEVLVQFGILGKLFAENIYKIKAPKVGLMNIGEEDEKGNLLSLATFPLMKEATQFNFIGNVEGGDLFNDKADVIVCDGFTGNIILKLAESFYGITLKKKMNDEFFDGFNYERYGGSPVLGVNAPVVIGHGVSNPKAIKNMVFLSRDVITSGLIEKIKKAFQ